MRTNLIMTTCPFHLTLGKKEKVLQHQPGIAPLKQMSFQSGLISNKKDRKYQFWKRDPLAISITSKKALLQKLDYIHNNPVQEKWKLADLPENYRWSSAAFYLTGKDEFGFLTHYDE